VASITPLKQDVNEIWRRMKDQQPLGDTPPEIFREQLHRLADWIADFRENIETLRVAPGDKPGVILGALSSQPPDAIPQTDRGVRPEVRPPNAVGVLPPYHSKYNPIERCWGILEMHWNGSLLDSIEAAVGFARSMTWKGKHPVVRVVETAYATGVRLKAKEMKALESEVVRLAGLGKWFVEIPAKVRDG